MLRLGAVLAALLLGAFAPRGSGTGVPNPPPILSVVIGSASEPVANQIEADSYSNCISSDNSTYLTADDTHAFGNAGSANMMIGKFTSESPLTGANTNLLSSYGGFSTADGTDGPGGSARSNKLFGLYCYGGNIYAWAVRQCRSSSCVSTAMYSQGAASPIKSTDHGATWANFQAPSSPTSTGTEPAPLGALFFSSDSIMGAGSFVSYGPDGSTPPPQDNAGTYAYIVGNDGYWDNGNSLYLARVPLANIANLSPSDYQFYTGGDGTNSANWSSSFGSAATILTNSGKLGAPSMQFIGPANRYLLFEWYYPTPTSTNSTTWLIYESPHPWGPFTLINTTNFSPQGWYNPVVLQRSVASSVPNSSVNTLTLLFAGDYSTCCGAGGYYHMFSATLQYNTH